MLCVILRNRILISYSGAESYGYLNLIVSYSPILVAIASFGLRSTALRIFQSENWRGHFVSLRLILLLTTFVVSICWRLISDVDSTLVYASVLAHSLFLSFQTLYSAIFQKLNKQFMIPIYQLFWAVGSIIIVLALKDHSNLVEYVIIIPSFGVLLFTTFYVNSLFFPSPVSLNTFLSLFKVLIKELRLAASVIASTIITAFILFRIRYVIAHESHTSLAFFSALYTFTHIIPNFLFSGITNFIYPVFLRQNLKEGKSVISLFRESIKHLVLFLIVGILAVLIVLYGMGLALEQMFGASFIFLETYSGLVAFTILVRLFATYIGLFVTVEGNYLKTLIIELFPNSALLGYVILYPGVDSYAVAICLSAIIHITLTIVLLKRES